MVLKAPLLALIISLVVLGIWWGAQEWPSSEVKLVFCDVGQGDAVLMIQGHNQALVDAGPDEKVLGCLRDELPFWDRQLELVVMTHPDQDHIGGIPAVLQRYQAKVIFMLDKGKATQRFEQVILEVERQLEEGAMVHIPSSGEVFQLGEIKLTVWHPLEEKNTNSLSQTVKSGRTFIHQAESDLWDNFLIKLKAKTGENNDSIVLFGQHKKVSWLLTGDLEQPGELALSQANLLRPINILKVGHHGAKTSTTRPFLQQLRPETAIISCGKNNRYGHPAAAVLANLTEVGSQIERIDESGTITLFSNGQQWWKEASR